VSTTLCRCCIRTMNRAAAVAENFHRTWSSEGRWGTLTWHEKYSFADCFLRVSANVNWTKAKLEHWATNTHIMWNLGHAEGIRSNIILFQNNWLKGSTETPTQKIFSRTRVKIVDSWPHCKLWLRKYSWCHLAWNNEAKYVGEAECAHVRSTSENRLI
jgi:hypothetical protein